MNAYQPLTTLEFLQKQISEMGPKELQKCILAEIPSKNGTCLSIVSKNVFHSILPNILDQQQAVRSGVQSLTVELQKTFRADALLLIEKLQRISKRTWEYLWDQAPDNKKPQAKEYIVRFPPLYSQFFEGDLSLVSHILGFLPPKLHSRIINSVMLAQTIQGRTDSPTLIQHFLHKNEKKLSHEEIKLIYKKLLESSRTGQELALYSKGFYARLPEISQNADIKKIF